MSVVLGRETAGPAQRILCFGEISIRIKVVSVAANAREAR